METVLLYGTNKVWYGTVNQYTLYLYGLWRDRGRIIMLSRQAPLWRVNRWIVPFYHHRCPFYECGTTIIIWSDPVIVHGSRYRPVLRHDPNSTCNDVRSVFALHVFYRNFTLIIPGNVWTRNDVATISI